MCLLFVQYTRILPQKKWLKRGIKSRNEKIYNFQSYYVLEITLFYLTAVLSEPTDFGDEPIFLGLEILSDSEIGQYS